MHARTAAAALLLPGLLCLASPLAASAAARRPATPSSVRLTAGTLGVSLKWDSSSATGFVVQQATNRAMTQHVHTYRIRGRGHQFSPYRVVAGSTYFFRVRALNGAAHSSFSAPVRASNPPAMQPVRVMTYNVQEADLAGKPEGNTTIAPWSVREPGVIQLIQKADPDVIAVQEAAAWTGAVKGPRQIDSIQSALGGEYALADTEIPPSQKHYFRTGCYILYNAAKYEAVGTGGHWSIGTSAFQRYAAYQVLQNRSTGARFLFVSPHLIVGRGSSFDLLRRNETRSMLAQANAYAADAHLPMVFAGDYNSHDSKGKFFDGPGAAMRKAGLADAFEVAQSLSNQRYDSANLYLRNPPAYGEDVDHIFVSPGVGVYAWWQVMNLKHGQFVGTIPSDHNPVVSIVKIPYRSSAS